MNEVVITGFGIISPLGVSRHEFRENLFAGKSGISDIRAVRVPADFPVPYAGLLPELPDSAALRAAQFHGEPISDFVRVTAAALDQIFEVLPEGLPVDGIAYGTAEGVDFDLIENAMRLENPDQGILKRCYSQTSVNFIADALAARGCCRDSKGLSPDRRIPVMAACASANVAIGLAFSRIRAGHWKRALAGAVNRRCSAPNLLASHALGALAVDPVSPACASRPFSKDRTGFVKAEGGAILLLESKEEALKNSRKIYAGVAGFGATSDGWRLTDGREDVLCAARAMELAIEDAGVEKSQISYINAHGTATPMNDILETRAIKMVFGAKAYEIPISSTKSQIGHAETSSGAQEAVACLMMFESGRIAPTLNLEDPDPECDLDYVPNRARSARLETILSNSFGFGGQNACLVFKAPHLVGRHGIDPLEDRAPSL